MVSEACKAWAMRNRGRRVVEAAYVKIENAQKPDESRGQDV